MSTFLSLKIVDFCPQVSKKSPSLLLPTPLHLGFQYLLTDIKGEKKNVGFIQLNRPKALNALCDGKLMSSLEQTLLIYCLKG